MLTVKHIRHDGAETIDSAERVIFYAPEGMDSTPTPHVGGSITAVNRGGIEAEWFSGTVYVMNERGATIAKYDMGGGPAPRPITQAA